MTETLISPGVLTRENDQSFINQGPITFGAALIGPAIKGPVGIPTSITSFAQYSAVFGGAVESGSQFYTYLNTIAAQNYFSQGGESLLITRVVSGSFTSAFTSGSLSGSNNSGITTLGFSDSGSVGYQKTAFQLKTISEGKIMNNWQINDSSGGTLNSGSADNIRWEINSVNTSSGTFSLLIRRGNDTQTQKAILETYNNISMDPISSNYISKIIGNSYQTLEQDGTDFYLKVNGEYPNKSNYVYVSEVSTPTPNYFDNNGAPKPQYTGSLPGINSGSFAGAEGSNISVTPVKFNENITATNIQGLSPNNYTASINLLSNKDDYQFNVITAPGLIYSLHPTQTNMLVSLAESRQDCIAIIDLNTFNSTINSVTNNASSFDSSYTATYWPWLQSVDPNTAQSIWSPASVFIPGVFSFTDSSSDPWFAPAGLVRGALGSVIRAERKLTSGNRDTLYNANINPIATFPGNGTVVFGQKTLQKRASALDRVNVRRLLITLKSYIGQIADNLVFEQNSTSTRNSFLAQVNPYLESIQQRQGLYSFRVIMDESNNTPERIDRNELIGQIYIQPTRTAEFVILDFTVSPTGTSFS